MQSLVTRCKPLALIVAVVAAFALPATAGAQGFGLKAFSAGASTTQAGAHADVSTSFTLNTDELGQPIDQLKNVQVNLPPGIVGNPQAIPKCSDRDFQNFNCPADAQVGFLAPLLVATPAVKTTFEGQVAPTTLTSTLSPCGFCQTEQITVASTAGMRSGDYVTVGTGATAEQLPIQKVIDGTTLNMSIIGNGVQNTHNPGEVLADDTITVDNTSGFNATAEGDDNLITIGNGANAEDARIEFAPGDQTHLILTQPLTKTHTPGVDPVIHKASLVSAPIALFNMQPDPGHVATLAASLLFVKITVDIDVRTDGTYGLTANLRYASTFLTLGGASLTLWGVPGDPSHDSERCGQLGFSCGTPSSVPKAAFMTNPTNCGGGRLTTTITVDSWENPDQQVPGSTTQDAPTGCDKLSFSPGLTVSPDTSQAGAPAGYSFDLTVPQSDTNGLATPDVQNVTIALPAGTALSPAAANGLQGCSDAQFAAGSCPDAAKVGSVSITTPLLPDQLTGTVWIGSPTPTQMFRLFLIATGDNVTIKLTGNIHADPNTGQLTTVFANNPQLPFSRLHLSLFGGPQAPLANPEGCGTFTTTSDIAPYGAPASGPDATPSSSFGIGGCTGAFAPTFAAGTANPSAGAFSPFTLTFSRQDTDRELSSISATLPPGLFAKIAGVPLCPSANASNGTCSAASRVGTATVGSGAGSHPLFLSGPVYLTGPYNGGAYGLATVVPAIAGPYNLGTVVVRQSLRIDPNDAHVTAVSDPFPTILDGVPLRIRTVNLTLDRPNFIVNPTTCAPSRIAAAISAVGGGVVPVSSRFQVGNCGRLPFHPSLGISLSGKGQTKSGKHPTLTATLKAPSSGQANIQSAKVKLPLSIALDPKNSQVVCSVAAAAAFNCPAKTIVGKATAVSPLLPHPLSGNIFLVQGIRTNSKGQQIKTLPSLLIPLKGDVALNLRAKTSVDGAGRLVSTFSGIPDAAVSNFKLTINGGRKGILVVTGRGKSICKSAQNGTAGLKSHSNSGEALRIKFGTPACGSKKTKKSKPKHSGNRTGRR